MYEPVWPDADREFDVAVEAAYHANAAWLADNTDDDELFDASRRADEAVLVAAIRVIENSVEQDLVVPVVRLALRSLLGTWMLSGHRLT